MEAFAEAIEALINAIFGFIADIINMIAGMFDDISFGD